MNVKQYYMSRKRKNKVIKTVNGNISKSEKSLKLLHWNLGPRYWSSKTEDIQGLVDEMTPHICFISEANLFQGLDSHLSQIIGYELITTKAMSTMGYSRLVLLVKQGVNIEVQEAMMDDSVASIWLKIKRRGCKTVTLGGVYREHSLLLQGYPNTSNDPGAQTLRWKRFVDQWRAASTNTDCFVLGDTNLDMFKWTAPDFIHEDMVTYTKDEIQTLNFSQVIVGATRSWPGAEDSLLDQCWTNCPERIISKRNIVRAVGDHNVIEVIVRMKGKDSSAHETRKRHWKNFNLDSYRQGALSIQWEDLYKIKNLDVAQHWMEEKLGQLLDSVAPWKSIQPRRNYRNWIAPDTKLLMKDRDTIRELARTTKSAEHWKHYRTIRNTCNKKVKQDRIQHFKTRFEDMEQTKDTKGTYKLMKQQAGWSTGSTPLKFQMDGRSVTAPQELADLQIEHYQTKIKLLLDGLPTSLEDPLEHLEKALEKWEHTNNRLVFKLKPTTEMEVLKSLKEIGNSSSCGLDGQDATTLKAIATIIYKPLTHIINMTISHNKFPNRWKIAKVLPLYKGKNKPKDRPDSYRPISLLSVTSKITERVVQRQLSEYLEKSGQMNMNQHSYRQNHSTTTAWAQLTDTLFTATDKNMVSAILAVDQSSAFDCVSHTILIKKLAKYNLSKETLQWLSSYLANRTYCVSIGTKLSSMKPVISGVPQGSVLGPTLYAMYTNELPNILKDSTNCTHYSHNSNQYLFGENCPKCGIIICYADDATMVIASHSRPEIQNKLKTGLDKIDKFLVANKLAINRSKTMIQELMIPQKRAKLAGDPPLLTETNPDGTTKLIRSEEQTRLLGGTLQDNMSWGAHLEWGEEALIPAARKKLGVLKHLGKSLPQKSRKMLADGYVLSKIRYLMAIWGGAPEKYLKMIQVLLNDTARFVLDKSTRRDSTSDLMRECGWLAAAEMVEYNSLTLLWRIVRKNCPRELAKQMTPDDDNRILTTRPRLLHTTTAFRWRAAYTWNLLPSDIRDNMSLPSFKTNLKKWLIAQRGQHLDPGDGLDT